MTEYFGHVRGGLTTYVPGDGNSITECRHMLIYFGEDVSTCLEQFWREHNGDFVIIPQVAYGVPPRPELCSKQSLTQALKTAKIDVNGIAAQAWKKACEAHNVPWNAHKAAPGWKAQERTPEPAP